MDVRRLRYFLEVADAGSFTAAAQRLRIAQPALSKQVKLLEEEFGFVLFARHGRGVTMTEAGEATHERGLAILRQLDMLRFEVSEHVKQLRGPIALGMPPSLRELITTPVVSDFYKRYPEARLRVVEANVTQLRDQVASGALDLAVAPEWESANGLEATPLAHEAMCMVGPLGAGLKFSRPRSIRHLLRHPLMTTSRPNTFRRQIERALVKTGHEFDIRLEVDTPLLATDLIARCGCYSFMPASAVQSHVARGEISAAPIIGQRVLWMVTSLKERARSPTAQALGGFIKQQAAREILEGRWMTGALPAVSGLYGQKERSGVRRLSGN